VSYSGKPIRRDLRIVFRHLKQAIFSRTAAGLLTGRIRAVFQLFQELGRHFSLRQPVVKSKLRIRAGAGSTADTPRMELFILFISGRKKLRLQKKVSDRESNVCQLIDSPAYRPGKADKWRISFS